MPKSYLFFHLERFRVTDMSVTKQQIISDLTALGIEPGITVMMHSSLSALGPVKGGPEAVVDALSEVVGPDGKLLVPAFRDSVWEDYSDFRKQYATWGSKAYLPRSR